jgi:hypothetical protein
MCVRPQFPGSFTAEKQPPVCVAIRCTGAYTGPRTGLDAVENIKISIYVEIGIPVVLISNYHTG